MRGSPRPWTGDDLNGLGNRISMLAYANTPSRKDETRRGAVVPEARHIAETWHNEYSQIRPHSSLGYQTPAEFAATGVASGSAPPTATQVAGVPIPRTLITLGSSSWGGHGSFQLPLTVMPSSLRPRLRYVDFIYTFAITLVLLGHSLPSQWGDLSHPRLNALSEWIYSFHMPLFMAVSGFVFMHSSGSRGFGAYLRRRVQRIIVPYVAANVLYLGSKWVFSLAAGESLESNVAAFLLYPWASHCVILWFLPTLFWISLLLYPAAVHWSSSPRGLFLVTVVLAAGHVLEPFGDVDLMGLSSIVRFAVFYWMGCVVYVYRDPILALGRRGVLAPLVIFGLHSALLALGVSTLATATLGVLASFSIAVALTPTSSTSAFGRSVSLIRGNAYQIYLFAGLGHTPARRIFTDVVPVGPALLVPAVFLGGAAASVVAIWVLRRFFPILCPLFGMPSTGGRKNDVGKSSVLGSSER